MVKLGHRDVRCSSKTDRPFHIGFILILVLLPGPFSLISCVVGVQILLQGKNPGVVWEYTLPRTERKPDYSWGVVRSDCSAPCAGGEVVSLAL